MTTDPDDSPAPARGADVVQIVERSVDHPDAVRLLGAFYAEQVGRYGFAESVDLEPREYGYPHGAFAVAYHCGNAVGCGGYRIYAPQPDTVEIKKLYLEPGARGHGVGRAMLNWLEHRAACGGAKRVLLETGCRNTAALRLFAVSGYQPAPRYVQGRDPAINRAFTKALSLSSSRSLGVVWPTSVR